MSENVEIYQRPTEIPKIIIPEQDIRLFYAGQWVDFRDGAITICGEPKIDQTRKLIREEVDRICVARERAKVGNIRFFK